MFRSLVFKNQYMYISDQVKTSRSESMADWPQSLSTCTCCFFWPSSSRPGLISRPSTRSIIESVLLHWLSSGVALRQSHTRWWETWHLTLELDYVWFKEQCCSSVFVLCTVKYWFLNWKCCETTCHWWLNSKLKQKQRMKWKMVRGTRLLYHEACRVILNNTGNTLRWCWGDVTSR